MGLKGEAAACGGVGMAAGVNGDGETASKGLAGADAFRSADGGATAAKGDGWTLGGLTAAKGLEPRLGVGVKRGGGVLVGFGENAAGGESGADSAVFGLTAAKGDPLAFSTENGFPDRGGTPAAPAGEATDAKGEATG
ncbi:MAG: hypothetical protein JWL81_1233 [Verrucomicrobiales bacterium]|nr:hypothetical protein [Verrucomicrobiales bacterium]